jgi:hypothetical protein
LSGKAISRSELGELPAKLKTTSENQHDKDDQDDTNETNAAVPVAVSVTAEAAAKATKQEDEEEDDEDESERHYLSPLEYRLAPHRSEEKWNQSCPDVEQSTVIAAVISIIVAIRPISVVTSMVVPHSQRPINRAFNPTDRTANDPADRTGGTIALVGPFISAAHNALSLHCEGQCDES